MKDVPTLTDTDTANYCTWNPLAVGTNITTASGNLNSTASSNSNAMLQGTFGITSGKWYWEVTLSSGTSAWAGSIIKSTAGLNYSSLSSGDAYSYSNDGSKYNGQTSTSYGNTYTTNDVIGVALDMDAGTITFYKNNVSQGTASTGLTGVYLPVFSQTSGATTGTINANFGAGSGFTYTPPTGFKALNTFNLPTPTIGATASTQANDYFDVSLYTGNGSSQSVTNSGSFQPDFVWVKGRSGTTSHNLSDAVRGTASTLFSNTTAAENGSSQRINAFNSNGFSVGNDTDVNTNTATYVGWQWRASNTTAVTNTAGSITSTVSANTTAGFSIVTYTGTGANATVGHGLGVAPKMVIVKRRDNGAGGTNWLVHHSQLNNGVNPAQYNLKLNLTNATAGLSTIWNDTAPTSTVFSVGTNAETNGSGGTFVAYCFAQVAGYSAFGSYTGNGSSDGPFIYTGFRPAFVMVKRTNTTGAWLMLDNKRIGYNPDQNHLQANLS